MLPSYAFRRMIILVGHPPVIAVRPRSPPSPPPPVIESDAERLGNGNRRELRSRENERSTVRRREARIARIRVYATRVFLFEGTIRRKRINEESISRTTGMRGSLGDLGLSRILGKSRDFIAIPFEIAARIALRSR